jgi:aryl-alcohol dehydrogenase-like predicted oxidoreductase
MSMANLSLAWVLHQPGVAAVLAGARKPEQLMENLQAVALELSSEIVRELARVTDQLKLRLGANPDPYLGSAESRFR